MTGDDDKEKAATLPGDDHDDGVTLPPSPPKASATERFAIVPGWAFEAGLADGPFRVLCALLLHADKSGRCCPSESTLARLAGRIPRRVRDSLRQLEDAGIVEVLEPGRGRRANVYRVRRSEAATGRTTGDLCGHQRPRREAATGRAERPLPAAQTGRYRPRREAATGRQTTPFDKNHETEPFNTTKAAGAGGGDECEDGLTAEAVRLAGALDVPESTARAVISKCGPEAAYAAAADLEAQEFHILNPGGWFRSVAERWAGDPALSERVQRALIEAPRRTAMREALRNWTPPAPAPAPATARQQEAPPEPEPEPEPEPPAPAPPPPAPAPAPEADARCIIGPPVAPEVTPREQCRKLTAEQQAGVYSRVKSRRAGKWMPDFPTWQQDFAGVVVEDLEGIAQ